MTGRTTWGLSENAAGALAYLTFLPAIVFLLLPPYCNSRFVRFHAWQSVFLSIAWFAISLALSVLMVFRVLYGLALVLAINWIIWLALAGCWLLCLLASLNGRRLRLPVLGRLAERQARH